MGWFRSFPGGLVSTAGLDHTLIGGEDTRRAVQPAAPQADRDLRDDGPGLDAAGPADRLRRALGRRRLRPVGRGRGPPGRGLRREPHPPAPVEAQGRRVVVPDPRRGREHRAHRDDATCSCTTATSASRSWTRVRSCWCPGPGVADRSGARPGDYRWLDAPDPGLHRALLRARRRSPSRTGRCRSAIVNRRIGAGRLPALQQAPAPAPDDLAHAGRGPLRRGHRGEHEPRRRPLGRPRARRADRARARASDASTTSRWAPSSGTTEIDAFAGRVGRLDPQAVA